MPSISQDEISRYWEIFQQQSPANGYLSGQQMMTVLQNSQLPNQQLSQIWELADIDKDGRMDFEEFCIAMRLVFDQIKSPGAGIPTALPQWLVPASKQHFLSGNSNLAGSNSNNDDEDMSLRSDFNWYMSPTERSEYETIYEANSDHRGNLSYDSLTDLYSTLNNVPSTDVSSAWNLVNPKSEEKIDKEQSLVFLHILNQRHKGVRLPRSVPATLRATFGKGLHNYDVNGPQSEIKTPALQPQKSDKSSGSNQKSSFAEGYMARLGLGGRSEFQSSGTSFNGTEDNDWEEVRLKRELADLESRLTKIEQAKSSGNGSKASIVRELEGLLAYKESQLKNQTSNSAKSTNLGSSREELDMIAEQLNALKEHAANREKQLASLSQELETLG